jgi:hypothetical protein
MVQERLNFIASVVVARKQRGMETAVKLLSESKADELSNEIKTLADDILAGEHEMGRSASSQDLSTEKIKHERLLMLAAFLGAFMIGSNVAFSRFN